MLKNKYNEYLSAGRDFIGGPFKVNQKYILCSSPRTGSTLLGQMLRDTNCAGDPLEYFNPLYLKALANRLGDINNFFQLLAFLEKHRTSSNGIFGLQIHWSHLNNIFRYDKNLINTFIDSFDKIIFLRRKDKIAQAVSLYRASKSKLWSSIDEDLNSIKTVCYYKNDEEFNPVLLTKILYSLIIQDKSWLNYLEEKNKKYLTVYYEDLIYNWNDVGTNIVNYITPYEDSIPSQKLRKQGPDEDFLTEKFRNYLGLI
jgi:LPS sulfotransferase NodH